MGTRYLSMRNFFRSDIGYSRYRQARQIPPLLALAWTLALLLWIGAMPSRGELCGRDLDCDDGSFCNGAELCSPEAPGADLNGCVAGSAPCGAPCVCNEDQNICESCGCSTDSDGDGHISLGCGGDDCNDQDGDTYPGNFELCDAISHDEDCDPTTYGQRDLDGDRWVDGACCNQDVGGYSYCGPDCDDATAGTNPASPEVCDAVDNDCDGSIDEDLLRLLYPDADQDGWGTSPGSLLNTCTASQSWSTKITDCNDSIAPVHPGALELCNGIDDDCDGLVDEGFSETCP